MYQIHEVCERCHLSRKAIRLYEEKGLLHPDRIQGNRMYNKEDVVRLQCISYYRGPVSYTHLYDYMQDVLAESYVETWWEKGR